MPAQDFAFINISDTWKLSPRDAKKARGHITKSTWTNYRTRKSEFQSKEHGGHGPDKGSRTDRRLPKCQDFVTATPTLARRDCQPRLAHELQSLLESNLSDEEVLKRISTSMTMSMNHIDHFLTMMRETQMVLNDSFWRHLFNTAATPCISTSTAGQGLLKPVIETLILSAVNNIFGVPRLYRKAFFEQVECLHKDAAGNIKDLLAIARVSTNIMLLRSELHRLESAGIEARDAPPEIQQEWMRLVYQCRGLHVRLYPCTKIASKAMELLLHLTVYDPVTSTTMGPLATELYEGYQVLESATVLDNMRLASGPILIGALASTKGSEAREWFISTIRSRVRLAKDEGCDDPLIEIFASLSSDGKLLQQLESVWREETNGDWVLAAGNSIT